MAKAQKGGKGGKTSSSERRKAEYKIYRTEGREETNKMLKHERHAKVHPNDKPSTKKVTYK